MKIIDNEEASVIHFFRRFFNKIARDIFNFKTFSSLNVTFCVAITTVCVHYLPTVLLFKCKILLKSLEELLQTLPLYFRIHYKYKIICTCTSFSQHMKTDSNFCMIMLHVVCTPASREIFTSACLNYYPIPLWPKQRPPAACLCQPFTRGHHLYTANCLYSYVRVHSVHCLKVLSSEN